ncbi:MAG: helix-turn-helix transcriptional regulator, partial [Treponema sp.]|nr:helix-turn-helix transcriptional regulator [Treponema sp.]
NKEISDELFISVHTVEDYVSDLYDKCEVKNRVELIEKFR